MKSADRIYLLTHGWMPVSIEHWISVHGVICSTFFFGDWIAEDNEGRRDQFKTIREAAESLTP